MGFQDFVSETEAATLSGVSVATLRRFSEVGYLKVEKDADGVPLFSKSELGAVFGTLAPAALAQTNFMPSNFTQPNLTQANLTQANLTQANSTPSSAKPSGVSAPTPPPTRQSPTEATSTSAAASSSSTLNQSEKASEPAKSGAVASLFELLGKDKRPLDQQVEKDIVPAAPLRSFTPAPQTASGAAAASPLAAAAPQAAEASNENLATLVSTSTATSTPAEVAPAPELPATPQKTSAENLGSAATLDEAAATQITQLTALLDDMRSENRKLRTVVDLQEKILTIRENEIRDLKEQRDWLKSRLERLEEKADRDQLLLLSETQTIRRLISLQEPKKSTFRLALDWLGVTNTNQESSNQEGGSTIEVRSSGNQRPGNTNSNFSDSPRGSEARKNQDSKGAGRSNREAA